MFGIFTSALIDIFIFVFGIGLISILISAGAVAIVKQIAKTILGFVSNVITGILNIFKGGNK